MFENAFFRTFEGEATAILGKNGSGKSTFLKALSGVREIDCGEILLDGTSVFKKEARCNIGFVPQGDVALGDLSVRDNLYFWGAAYGLDNKSALQSPVVEVLGLSEVLKEKVKRLSGGMRKRLCIAVSLLHNPKVIILDEPFSAIDIIAKQELLEYLISFKNEGRTIVITSHNASELMALCGKFCYIAGKKIEEVTDMGGFIINPEKSVARIIKQGEF